MVDMQLITNYLGMPTKMAERLEYSGDPLPTGLPGFGGGTVDILILPGFNRVVAPQKFLPVNDAPAATPPDPDPPAGSNPEDPTDEVVEPADPPAPPDTPDWGPALAKKLSKRPPCDEANLFFRSLIQCGFLFNGYVVCDGGEPVEDKIFTFDVETFG